MISRREFIRAAASLAPVLGATGAVISSSLWEHIASLSFARPGHGSPRQCRSHHPCPCRPLLDIAGKLARSNCRDCHASGGKCNKQAICPSDRPDQMPSMRTGLYHTARRKGKMPGPRQYQRATPEPRIRQARHRPYRPYREEAFLSFFAGIGRLFPGKPRDAP